MKESHLYQTLTEKSHAVLDSLRLQNGMYLAAGSSDYHYVWLRDTFYEVRPLLHKDPKRYLQTYRTILELLKNYQWKIVYHGSHRAEYPWQYIHARYCAESLSELPVEWGHAQHDAVGAILFGIAEGEAAGLPILSTQEDYDIIQNVVDYLGCCQYWNDKDNGMWEEERELHSSSIGAVLAAFKKLRAQGLAIIPEDWIQKGQDALDKLLPWESPTKSADLAQLSLIYPYRVVCPDMAKTIIGRVESLLLRKRGVLRYEKDSYYSLVDNRNQDFMNYLGNEAEWTFGLPWLALCHLTLKNTEQASRYLEQTESVMLEDGGFPELYYAHSPIYGTNTPLGWSSAMYIMAMDEYNKGRMHEQIQLF